MEDNKDIKIETVKTNVLGQEVEVTRSSNNLSLEQLALKIDELTNLMNEKTVNNQPQPTDNPFDFTGKELPERIKKIKNEWGLN